MTPYDEWDFDGINEMILADINVKGKPTKALVHFDRNGFGYTLDRVTGALLVAEKYDPKVNWATQRRHEDRPSAGGGQVLAPRRTARTSTPRASARRRWAPRTSSRPPSTRRPSCSTCRPTTSAWTTSRSRSSTSPASRMSAPRCRCIPAPGSHGGMGNFITWDAGTGKIVQSPSPRSSRCGAARSTPPAASSCYGTLEGYLKCVDAKDINKELCKFKTPSGIIGNVFTYRAQGQAVHRRVLGHRRLGRHRHGGGAREGHRTAWARWAATRSCSEYTELGGSLTVFALPELTSARSTAGSRPASWRVASRDGLPSLLSPMHGDQDHEIMVRSTAARRCAAAGVAGAGARRDRQRPVHGRRRLQGRRRTR